MIKTFNKVGIAGTHLNIIKATYDNPTASIILNCEKLKEFLLISGKKKKKQRCTSWLLLLNIMLDVLATAIRK